MHLASPDAAVSVTVVGGANMDISAKASGALTAGDSTPGSIHYSAGGVGRNIAENLARLGVAVNLLSVVGDDAFGRQLLVDTARAGVGVTSVVTVPGQRTATYLSMHQPDGEVAMAVNDMGILDSLTADVCRQSPALAGGDGWLLLDCNLPVVTLAHLLALGRKVAVDGVSVAKCRRITGVLSRIELLKLNHLEASALSGLPLESMAQCVAAVQHFLDLGVAKVLISHGAAGLAWGQQGVAPRFRRSRPVVVVSSTGAGDALLAGVLAGLLKGHALEDAVNYGVACAEITLSSTFANSPELTDAAVRHHLSATA